MQGVSTLARLIKQDRGNYTNISNQLIRDSRLSWKARGIFAYLWSQADEWDFYVSEVAKHATDGRDALRSGLKELEKYGYLTRKPRSDANGKFDGMDWVLTDKPVESVENTVNGKTQQKTPKSLENTLDGKAVRRDKRPTEDHTLRNNNSKNYQKKEVTTERNKDNSQTGQSSAATSPVNDEEKIPYKEIIDYLNQKAGKSFKYTGEEHREYIRARWQKGYRLEDFQKVIDNKCADWLGVTSRDGQDMTKYLRPKTLFAKKHFDDYLNEQSGAADNDDRPEYQNLFANQWQPQDEDDLPF
ncbi:putative dnaA analog [Lactobacillus phage LL-H]|uniref:replication initiation protein n=1 Tax=Lactococcus phage LL-H TaxID=12348 RepID=UPI000009B993|nr:replication initiation protein [Lactobacillus phage LL-H]AAL77546.1 putative dnaA analog [Lactobacillus phage LL-H]